MTPTTTPTTTPTKQPKLDRLRLAFLMMVAAEGFVACDGGGGCDCNSCPILGMDGEDANDTQEGKDGDEGEPDFEHAMGMDWEPDLPSDEAPPPRFSIALAKPASGSEPGRASRSSSTRPMPGSTDGSAGGPISIVAGDQHSCVLLDSGEIECWGVLRGLDVDPIRSPRRVPTRLANDEPILALAAGGDTTCALLASGDLGCWGPEPWQRIELRVAVETLAIDDDHGCGLAAGQLWCWALEEGNESDVVADLIPTPRASTLLDDSLASTRGCLLLGEGELRCWDLDAIDPVPVGLEGQRSAARALATEPGHTCILGDDPDITCWAFNPSDPAEAKPERIELGVAKPALDLALGHDFGCARFEEGLRCWGRNDHGQLGLGAVERSSGVVPLPGPVVAMALGAEHACASLDAGEVYCWGRGDLGQLGHGGREDIGDDEAPTAKGAVPIQSR